MLLGDSVMTVTVVVMTVAAVIGAIVAFAYRTEWGKQGDDHG